MNISKLPLIRVISVSEFIWKYTALLAKEDCQVGNKDSQIRTIRLVHVRIEVEDLYDARLIRSNCQLVITVIQVLELIKNDEMRLFGFRLSGHYSSHSGVSGYYLDYSGYYSGLFGLLRYLSNIHCASKISN